jgi:molecular chaperone HscA
MTIERRYRAMHDIGHFRFFECAAFDEAGHPRGEIAPLTDVLFPFASRLRSGDLDLSRVPVRRLEGTGPLVSERYDVDACGTVQVTLQDLESGFARTHVIGAASASAS